MVSIIWMNFRLRSRTDCVRSINCRPEGCHRTREPREDKFHKNLSSFDHLEGSLNPHVRFFAFSEGIHFSVLTVLWQTFTMGVCAKSGVQQDRKVDTPCIPRGILDFEFSGSFSVNLALDKNSLFMFGKSSQGTELILQSNCWELICLFFLCDSYFGTVRTVFMCGFALSTKKIRVQGSVMFS